jgi:hypothetical protein
VDVFTLLFNLLYSLRLRLGGKNKLHWVLFKRWMFDVRSYFKVLVPHESASFPWKNIWQHNVLLRAMFFSWTATLGKILPMDNLRKQCVIVVNCYCMCKRSGEMVDHLLLHYKIAGALWSPIFSRLG